LVAFSWVHTLWLDSLGCIPIGAITGVQLLWCIHMVAFLKWRLSKHQQTHSIKTTKKCHYFNNGKACPYEDIGCMFAHEQSDICKFGKLCRNNLCSYMHKKKKKIERGDKLDKSKEKDADDGDESDKHTEDNLDIDNSEIDDDDDETEIIFQKFLKNHEKRENEQREKMKKQNNKPNEENVAAQMQQFKFVSA
jgi:hypothetical protein